MSDIQAKYEAARVELAAEQALAEAGANRKLLKPHVVSRLRVIGDEVLVVDTNGEPTTHSVVKLIDELKSDPAFGLAFGGASQDAVKSRADLRTVRDKVEFIEKHGQQAFNALPEK